MICSFPPNILSLSSYSVWLAYGNNTYCIGETHHILQWDCYLQLSSHCYLAWFSGISALKGKSTMNLTKEAKISIGLQLISILKQEKDTRSLQCNGCHVFSCRLHWDSKWNHYPASCSNWEIGLLQRKSSWNVFGFSICTCTGNSFLLQKN